MHPLKLNFMKKNNKLYLLVIIMTSCSTKGDYQVIDAPYEQICRLGENIGMLGEPLSMAIVDESHFVVSDLNSNVYLYDFTGNQVSRIGNVGRAGFEYIFPMNVRVYNGDIYVWSANTGKFISYEITGAPIAEYGYQSAIRDFLPTEHKIYIYTAGLRDGNVIDVYDKSTQKIESSLTETSDIHKLMLCWISVTPMMYMNNIFYYASRDNLDVFRYSEGNAESELDAEIQSDTFETDKLSNPNIQPASEQAREYMIDNDMIVMLSPAEDGYYVITREGEKDSNKEGDAAYEDMRIVVYAVSEDGASSRLADYSYSSFGSTTLFSTFGHDIFYLKHSVNNGEDTYSLRKLLIHD